MRPEVILTSKEPDRKPEANLYLPNKKEAPEGLKDVGIGKEVTWNVTGKAKSVSMDDWDGGSLRITIEISDLTIETGDDTLTLGDAIEKAKKRI